MINVASIEDDAVVSAQFGVCTATELESIFIGGIASATGAFELVALNWEVTKRDIVVCVSRV
ncbi:unnamed protein product [Camellia sinensis]